MTVDFRKRFYDFNPSAIEWKHQSSHHSEFGFWRAGGRNLFVKRFAHRPCGWPLLQESVADPIPGTPKILATRSDERFHYMFMQRLEGDTLWNILRSGEARRYFSASEPSDADKLKIFASVYAIFGLLHQRGYWYPDLDFKNIYLVRRIDGYNAYLIDIDSCAPIAAPYHPADVAQTFWEGLVRTYHHQGRKFIRREGGDASLPILQTRGDLLNQSMLLLFAYALQRLGKVPPEHSLFDPLTDPRNPHATQALEIHATLARGESAADALEPYLASYFKMTLREFKSAVKTNLACLAPSALERLGSFFTGLFGKKSRR
jgi:hypothetical protein